MKQISQPQDENSPPTGEPVSLIKATNSEPETAAPPSPTPTAPQDYSNEGYSEYRQPFETSEVERTEEEKDAGSMSVETTHEAHIEYDAEIDPKSDAESDPDTQNDSDAIPYPEEVLAQLDLSEEATRIADQLEEPMVWMIQNAIDVVGLDQVEAVLQETQAVEAEGGMWTAGNERRRTPGGVFFKLLKDKTDRNTTKRIFEPPPPIRDYLDTVRPKGPAHPPPLTPLPWSKVRTVVNKLLEQSLEKCIVRITLMGRPSQVSKTKSCVVVALKGQRPPSLPKGLPPVPEDSEYSFAVFIAHKHWSRVAPIMAQDANAKLIVEGYPVFDAKRGVTIVLAQHTRVTNSGFRHRQAVNFR